MFPFAIHESEEATEAKQSFKQTSYVSALVKREHLLRQYVCAHSIGFAQTHAEIEYARLVCDVSPLFFLVATGVSLMQ